MQDSTLDTAAWAAQLLQSPWSITGLTCPGTNKKIIIVLASLPYFKVKLSCVCLMFADKKKIAYSYLKVT